MVNVGKYTSPMDPMGMCIYTVAIKAQAPFDILDAHVYIYNINMVL